jgi:phosphatidylglycerophosphate synthase
MAETRLDLPSIENSDAMTLPNILSCSRYVLAFAMAYLVVTESWIGAAMIFVIAVITDI